ncbi:MAG: response regulator [Chloroflexi bacterium]|nr:response regulator [Chloroflexota bacterium]
MRQPIALIVEDDAQLAEIFAFTLRSIQLTTAHAADGQAALTYLATHVPDLVLLDLNLPHTNGTEILRTIRADERLKDIPVILATADDRLAETVRTSADLTLHKPVSPEQLRLLATRLLSRTKSA